MILSAYKKFWRQTFHLSGVATRSEFWCAFLVNLIIEVIFQALQYLRAFDFNEHPSARVGTGNPHMNHWLFAGGDNSVMANTFAILAIIFMLTTLIPKLTLAIRRSHDFNWSGHWIVGLWTARVILIAVTLFEVVMLVINFEAKHVNGAEINLLVGTGTLLVFFILELVELVILTKKSKRPNRFIETVIPAKTVE